MKEKELYGNSLVDYWTLILCPLESLFEGAREDCYGISLPGGIVLATIRENIVSLIEMLKKEFGDVDVLYEPGDHLQRPVKISVRES